MTPDKGRKVMIDAETATETVTQQEDIERIRREAGVEEGDPPPRGMPTDILEEFKETTGPDDRRIDRALRHRDGPQAG